MPRKKVEAQIPDSEEQAKVPKKWTAKQEKQHQKLKDDLEQTLARHREEMARLAAEQDAKEAQEAEQPETEQQEAEQPEAVQDSVYELEVISKPEEALEDPTIGQDITHNTELTMEEFFEKTRSLIQAASNALRTMEYKYGVVARKLETVSRHLKHRDAFERAIGFQYASEAKWVTPRLTKCPHCGRAPSLQREKGGKGWLVICDECWTRAETADGPMAAVKNWNEGKETEISRMVNRPLTEI